MQVYKDIHKNGIWTCPTCGYTNSVNFDKVETYMYPPTKMKFGVTYHFIPYNEEHETEVVKWETEKQTQFMRAVGINLNDGGIWKGKRPADQD
jgi:hypothetical protein